MTAIASTLLKIVPLAIDLFAKLLNLSGITKAIKKVIDKVTEPIHDAIDKAVAWMVKKVRSWIDKLKGKGKKKKDGEKEDANQKLEDKEVGKTVEFKADNESHKLWITNKNGQMEVMVASVPKTIPERLSEWKEKLDNISKEGKKEASETIISITERYSF